MSPCRWIDPGPTGLCTFTPPPTTKTATGSLPETGGSGVLLAAALACVAVGGALRRLAHH